MTSLHPDQLLSLTVSDPDIIDLLNVLPRQTERAVEIALDKTAMDIKQAVVKEMKTVFDSPTRYTLNSLKVTRTHNHNMEASVWFNDPPRMGQHYLVPQIKGGSRRHKGFEKAFGDTMFVPGNFARMTKAGNVSPGQILQILSVLGKAERMAGSQRNMTARSAKRNKAQRDYVYIAQRHGKLWPGIYKRFAKRGQGVKSGNYQARQKGQRRGRFVSAIRARGLRPIMLVGKQQAPIKPLLPFYDIAERVQAKNFHKHFDDAFAKQLAR